MMPPDKPDNRPLRRVPDPDPDNHPLQRVRALPGEIEHAFANLTETNPFDNPRWTFWQAVAWVHFRRREDINEFSFHPFRARAYARAALAQLRAAITEGRVVAFDTEGHQLHPMASLGRNPAVFLQSAEILRCFSEDRTKPVVIASAIEATPAAATDRLDRTGAPGRPTTRALVEQELDRMIAGGEVAGSIKEMADRLAAWLEQSHPSLARMTSKTIRNAFGPRIRKALARK